MTTTLTPFQQITAHLAEARRLLTLSNLDWTNDNPLDADFHAHQAHDELDAARELIELHHPRVVYHGAHTGTLHALDAFTPTEWVRVIDEQRGTPVTIHWTRIEEKAL